ncbi:muramoyltetrapeptide carboxypeptidase [Sphingobium sp. OAS761]|uniref:S66 peptidase family protein n=1 Tax=Sphingobium sp. OAS761 TaxID=2817901 RepID=UPI00209F21A4|nr:LD-carboxypeptidase [Sphingobium sp. OAS761]MCP1468353.1 muramoyltetrapeptide carboxypeptidase [Sphingobium sp. OAS761]
MRIDRRALIAGAGAMLAASRTRAAQAVAPAWIKPQRLRAGDTVGLIQPAGFADDAFDIALVEDTVRAMGLTPRRAPHLLDRYGYLAGKDADRAADVTAMYADPVVKAVFAVRGGWGCARILPHLDFRIIRANPKLLVGYSDITALHMAFAARAGFTTIHGPVASSGWDSFSRDSFRAVAFDAQAAEYHNPVGTQDRLVQRIGRTICFHPGKATGRLLGGNLTVLSALAGTPWLPDFTGAILFIEDIGEQPYRIDRMLTQLGQAGILPRLAGVVFGQCTDCAPGGESYGGFTLSEVLQQHLEPLGIPAFQGAQFGHVASQFSLPIGIRAEMDAQAGTLRLLEPAVS